MKRSRLGVALLWLAAIGNSAIAQVANYRVERLDGLHFEIQSFRRKDPNFHFLDMKGRRIVRPISAIARIVPLTGEEAIVVNAEQPQQAMPDPVVVAALPWAPPLTPAEEARARERKAADSGVIHPVFRVRKVGGAEFFAVNYSHDGLWRVFLLPEGNRSRHLAESVETVVRLSADQSKAVAEKIAARTTPEIDARVSARTEARKAARRTARWEAFNGSMAAMAQVDAAMSSQMQSLQAAGGSGGYGFGGYGPDGRAKTVHVNSYYRQDGTFVHDYWRRPPIR